jgi:DNA polymerase III alpha subunit
VPLREWTKRERLECGARKPRLYLTGHPFQDFAEHCKKSRARVDCESDCEHAARWRAVSRAQGSDSCGRRDGRAQARAAVSIVLDDDTERIEVTMFEDVYLSASTSS